MSTSHDQLISVLSRWLARDVPNEQLREEIEAIGTAGLEPAEVEAVDEVVTALASTSSNGRGHLERVVRETIEALALGA